MDVNLENKVNNTKGGALNPVLAVIIMIAITVVLGGTLWASLSQIGGVDESAESIKAKSAAYEEDLGKQRLPREPIAIEIYSQMDVEYVLVEYDLICFYTLKYSSTFKYNQTQNIDQVSIPLPKGTIEDLKLIVNGKVIDHPSIADNEIELLLPAGRDNIVVLEYTAYGTDSYSHEIPKNKYLEHFNMKLEILGVDFDFRSDLPKKCLTPDTIENNNEKIVMEWQKPNSIIKKDVFIELPKESNPFINYLYFLPALILLIIFISYFYFEGFVRVKMKFKNEHIGFIIAPMLTLYLIIGIMLVYLESYITVPLALLSFVAITFFIQKRMLQLKKGLKEFFFYQSFSTISVSIFIFFQNSVGIVLGTIFLILTIFIILNFIKNYKKPVKLKVKQKHVWDLTKSINVLENERNSALNQVNYLTMENQRLRTMHQNGAYDRKYCINCGTNIDHGFEFCPKCGNELSKIANCSSCNVLLSGKEQFCPNCGLKNQGD
jgi:flagellin-like protein